MGRSGGPSARPSRASRPTCPTGVKDLRQEITASGGTVFFEGNAFGKDVTMIMGNGYAKGHAEITLQVLREHAGIRKLFEEMYA